MSSSTFASGREIESRRLLRSPQAILLSDGIPSIARDSRIAVYGDSKSLVSAVVLHLRRNGYLNAVILQGGLRPGVTLECRSNASVKRRLRHFQPVLGRVKPQCSALRFVMTLAATPGPKAAHRLQAGYI